MSRPSLTGRKPSSATEAAPKKEKVTDDLSMRSMTTMVRRDIYRELSRLALDSDVTVQSLVNEAIYDYLRANGRTITVPLAQN